MSNYYKPLTKAERQAGGAAALKAQRERSAKEAEEAGENYVRLVNLRYNAESALEEMPDDALKTILTYLMAALANG